MSRTAKKSVQIPPVYQPAKVEAGITAAWEKSSFANPDRLPGKRGKPFTISMPPPNATGVLHAGHAVMLAIQDIVARFQRMHGRKVLWLPGTDHAAIATQAVVEKLIAKEGATKNQLGREAFLERVKKFVADSQGTIRRQTRKMGSSCDWSRERYTLDVGLSAAVSEAFVRMYRDGLIYRGYRIVNWCPRCHSTLSDDEVEYKEQRTKFYYFKYGPVIIGTARPETKFQDKTIIVHPDDARYRHLHGNEMEIEWIEGKVKANIIADTAADKDFGTGAMTITPAHSFEDFELAKKYQLPVVSIIDEDGKLTPAAGTFAGKDARASREEIVAKLQAKGLVNRIDEDYVHNLSVCYRCGTPVEPLPSKQWFVNVSARCAVPSARLGYPKPKASLKELAAWVVKSGQIEIIPDRFTKTYFHWMDNLRDWCISRQIWFGHRIPVWYRTNAKVEEEIHVGVKPPVGDGWKQDPDTLDTWFSSGLWTFSTLGWPQKTKDLKSFHPTDLMETGYDLLFFWVARMILMSTYLVGELPFRQVYFHGMVRDKLGRKMSKSRPETAIDPVDMIEKYGADAMRLSLVIGTTAGNDTQLWEEKIASYRNFVNKLWNIARFVSMTAGELKPVKTAPTPKTLADRWILAELDGIIRRATTGLERYEFSAVGEAVYEFTWSKFADWYLEIAKIEGGKEKMLSYILQQVLKLWHPFTPFVTEHLWERYGAGHRRGGAKKLLMIQAWPKAGRAKAVTDFVQVQSVVTAIRNLRSTAKVEPAKRVAVQIAAGKHAKLLKAQSAVIAALARCSELTVEAKVPKPSQAASAVVSGVTIYVPLAGLLDVGKEQERLRRELDEAERYANTLTQKLANDAFTSRAPQQVVAAEREKLAAQRSKVEKLKEQLAALR